MALMWVASLLVLVVQNDLGSALLLFGISSVMLYIATGQALYVVVGLGSFALASWGAYAAFDRIGIRVQNWLDPWQDPLDTGFQQVQADSPWPAAGSSDPGWGWAGPGRSRRSTPTSSSPRSARSWACSGTLGILALYLVLVMRGYSIALAAPDGFARLLAAG